MTRLEAAIAELAAAIREEVRAEVERERQAPGRLLSVPEAAEMLGLGRTLVCAEISAGRLRSLRAGRRRLIPSSALAEYVSRAG